MTTIACRDTNGIIEIASDSCVDDGAVVLQNKLSRVDKVVFGTAGYCHDGDLFEHFLLENPIKKSNKKRPIKNVVYGYLLKFLEFYRKYHSIDSFHKSTIILIYDYNVFEIRGTALFQVESGTPCATGSGKRMALASMLNGRSPMLAVKDACVLDVYSRPPVHKITVDKTSGEIRYFKHDFSLS